MTNLNTQLSQHLSWKMISRNAARALLLAVATLSVTACDHLTSPHWGQKLESRTDKVPVQVWSHYRNRELVVQCAPANGHGWPINGESSYRTITTIATASEPIYDFTGRAMYPASTQVVIPSDCWSRSGYRRSWISNFRVSARNNDGKLVQLSVYDKDGLACLGEIAGGFGWSKAGGSTCDKRFSNNKNKRIPYIVFKTKN